ncbi:MAG: MBL fold metallo-hydrolase [Pseudomonadota bacterium]
MKLVAKLLGTGVLALIVFGLFFVWLSPQFGARDKTFSAQASDQSPHFNGEVFANLEGPLSDSVGFSTMRRYYSSPNRTPDWTLPVVARQPDEFDAPPDQTRLTWFGHSAVLLETAGKRLFIDPMLGSVPAPLPWLTGKRFNPKLPLDIDKIPELDAIVISHDHYDHLDYRSISKLKDRTLKFFVPLGVGAHLHVWGVEPEKIVELDWWQTATFDELELTATPAKHFSGRGFNDRDTTLWASWVIVSPNARLFFSGDSGYTPTFKKIGERYGPFDLAMVECGQYDRDWADVHMFPEQTVQVNQELNSKLLLPIHWGSFSIAAHTWDDPIKRATSAAAKNDVAIATPVIGQTLTLGEHVVNQPWWKNKPDR